MQAPRDYLISHQDGALDMTDFKLTYRNLGLRFFVDKARHQLLPTNTMRLRCLAKIDNFYPAHRETDRLVNIRKSQFDLLNQKLTNHRSRASSGSLQHSQLQLLFQYLISVTVVSLFRSLPR